MANLKKYIVCYDTKTNKIACFKDADTYPEYKVNWRENGGTFSSKPTGKLPLIATGNTFEHIRDFVDSNRDKILARFPDWTEYTKKVIKNEADAIKRGA